VARGAIIDEQALFDALATKQIAGAAIDTWYKYPGEDGKSEPASLPFHELDNIIMTPHTSGETAQTNSARLRDLAANFNRLLSVQALRNVVFP
jgi:phosphoglycerate dehydrogenase-like enzyme